LALIIAVVFWKKFVKILFFDLKNIKDYIFKEKIKI
jgi:hypothetical protein